MTKADLDSILSVGMDLRIKGLTGNARDEESYSKQQPTFESSRRYSNPISVHDPVSTTAAAHADGVDVQEKIETAMAYGFTKDQLKMEPGKLLKTEQGLAAVEDDGADNSMSSFVWKIFLKSFLCCIIILDGDKERDLLVY